MAAKNNSTDRRAGSGQGDFFAIDRRAWAVVCQHGINAAVAYLVLARGSGGDQRHTSWSVNAIETYTGISRPRGHQAIETLAKVGAVRIISGGTRPRYHIAPAHNVPGSENHIPTLTEVESELFEQLLNNGPTRLPTKYSLEWRYYPNPSAVAKQLLNKGRVIRYEGGIYDSIPYDADPRVKPDWIWLPNSLIDGSGQNAVAPVELVRQTQNGAAIRILIDMYHAHGLAADGGIHWRIIRQDFNREVVGQRGEFVVYGFDLSTQRMWNKNFIQPHWPGEDEKERVFWTAWNMLIKQGLVQLVPHIVEADTDHAEIVFPCGYDCGETAEIRLGDSAHRAGAAMLTPDQRRCANERGLRLAPIRSHLSEVQMVGIARLRYRPRTSATAGWFKRMAEWSEMADRFDELTERLSGGNAGLQYQGLSR